MGGKMPTSNFVSELKKNYKNSKKKITVGIMLNYYESVDQYSFILISLHKYKREYTINEVYKHKTE
jgi:hypothetical protein